MKLAKRPMINEALLIARLYWGYTQSEMSDALGVTQGLVSEIERGTKDVSMDLLEKYSLALSIPKSQLLFFSEEMEGIPDPRRGKLIVAEKVLRLLHMLKPKEATRV